MEEIGLIIEFLERKQNYRGQKSNNDLVCIVKVTEEGGGPSVSEEWEFSSWEELKNAYPTFKDLLAMFFESEHWNVYESDGSRVLFAEKIEGHVGLYDDYEDTLNYNDVE